MLRKIRVDGGGMVIHNIDGGGLYVVRPKFHQSHLVKSAGGWWWKHEWKQWVTRNPESVAALAKLTGWPVMDFHGKPEDAGSTARALDVVMEDLDGHPSAAVETGYMPPCPEGVAYLPYQRAGVEYAMGRDHVLIADEMGLGKAQPDTEPVLTPKGFVAISELRVGDLVVGSNGKATEVTGVFPQGEMDVYKVEFTDGSWTRCTANHLWAYQTRLDRNRNPDKWRVAELQNINFYTGPKKESNVFVPMVEPVEFEGTLPLDPWLAGALIGDGCFRHHLRFSNPEADVVAAVRASLPPDMEMVEASPGSIDYRITFKRGEKSGIRKILEDCGMWGKLSHEKQIPFEWLTTKVWSRLALLQGLLDTDGTPASGGGSVEFCTTSEVLSNQVRWLVQSLGGTCTIYRKDNPTYEHKGEKKTGRTCWRCYIKLPDPADSFCHSGQKKERMMVKRQRPPYRAIKRIVEDGREECRCISVAAQDKLYVTRDFICTHNTVQALGVVNVLGAGNVLVVCPAALKLNWRDEARKWLVQRDLPVAVLGQKEALPSSGFFVVNYDQLAKWQAFTHGRLWDVVIIDEAHYLGNAKSIRTRLCLGDAFGRGAIPAQKIVALTGTPVSNRVDELFPLLRRMLPDRFRFFAEFEERYGSGQNLGELQMLLRDKVMVRRMKKDVLKDLPAKWVRRIEIPCEHEPALEATARYREAKAKYAEMMRNPAGSNTSERAYALEVAQRGLQEAQSLAMRETKNAKTAAVVDFVAEAIEEARGSGSAKVVVFLWHATMAAALAHRFGSRAVMVTGEDSDPHRRRDAVDRFQNDPKVELFIGNLKAAGAGLTLTAANREIMAELHWNPALLAQAEDRAHRIGQTRGVIVDYLVCAGTIDEDIMRKVERKKKEAGATVDRA